jgi:DNA-binding IclR family transcriptional regulator
VNFLVEEHGKVFNLYDKVGGDSTLSYTEGEEFHMHTTAGGKAILATRAAKANEAHYYDSECPV